MATVKWTWSGGQQDDTIRVTASISGSATSAVLVVSTVTGLTSPINSAPATVDANGYAKMEVTGLAPGVRYYYGIKIDGVLSTWRGRCWTYPTDGQPASFTFGASTCSQTLSTAPIWRRIAARNPINFIHFGDFGYYDITTDDQDAFRTGYEAALGKLPRQRMMRDVALEYMWDNHDFGAPSGSGTDASKPAASNVYRQIVPSYDLPAGSGNNPIYHDYRIGRVPFIVTDQRWNLTPSGVDSPTSTMLGATQLAWFKQKMLDYKAAGAPVIFWISEQSWYGTSATSWSGGYTAERDDIAEFVEANDIPPVVILTGDRHYSAYQSGVALSAGGRAFPEHLASPIDQTVVTPSAAITPWTAGPFYNAHIDGGMGHYAIVDVYDNGGDDCWWVVNSWKCTSAVLPDFNHYRVDSRTPTLAPQMKLAYLKESGVPRNIKDSAGIQRQLYV